MNHNVLICEIREIRGQKLFPAPPGILEDPHPFVFRASVTLSCVVAKSGVVVFRPKGPAVHIAWPSGPGKAVRGPAPPGQAIRTDGPLGRKLS